MKTPELTNSTKSILKVEPVDVGRILKPLSGEDDLLEEMTERLRTRCFGTGPVFDETEDR